MTPYIPHTDADVKAMLASAGLSRVDELFEDIPNSVRLSRPLELPAGMSEYEVFVRLSELASKNDDGKLSFLGFGSYDHIIPSVVPHLAGRSEFYTSYTPYQAEMSQGLLQAIFEFQSMIAELTGLEVSNASLYDGATAIVEAASMALQSAKNADTILYSAALNPFAKRVLESSFRDTRVKLVELETENGITSRADLERKLGPVVAGVIVQSPNVFGYLEDYDGYADAIHANGSIFAISANPMSLGVFRSPGGWGADIAVGDVQPFGIAPCFGGPSAGYIAAREELLRKMPGRIVGKTVDKNGDRAFVLTLQAREQHIRRERATSNICSNQALAAFTAAVYLSTVGKQGIRDVATLCARKARYLFDEILRRSPVRPFADQPFFNEFSVVLPPSVGIERFQRKMRERGIFAGVSTGTYVNGCENVVTVAVTEKKTGRELDACAAAWAEAVK